jgi:hypothetical protein
MGITILGLRSGTPRVLTATLFDRDLAGLNDERIGAIQKRPSGAS